MSTTTSPKKLVKKQSLSILSSSNINQINNIKQDKYNKPAKERVISETTGLIKFSIKKPDYNEIENLENVPINEGQNTESNGSNSHDIVNAKRVPIYVPINKEESMKEKGDAQDLLFQMAAKQRTILDLTEQLRQANEELAQLEQNYRSLAVPELSNINDTLKTSKAVSSTGRTGAANMASSMKKSTSLMNMNLGAPKVNTEAFLKTQKQVADTLNQITSNISSTNFFSKGKAFIETNFNKNVQMGSGILNTFFETDKQDVNTRGHAASNYDSDDDSDETSLDETTQAFDYSVDFDLDRLNKISFNKKLTKTILKDLEEEEEEEESADEISKNTQLTRNISALSELSNEDYGGDAIELEVSVN